MSPYRIVVADDHVMFRQGLKMILGQMPHLEVIGEANDGLELLDLLTRLTPDMVILDISMPKLRGIEAIREIRTNHATIKVLILTMHQDIDFLQQAVSAGANGYLLKGDADKELFTAIEAIQQGKMYVSPLISSELTDDWAQIYRGDRRAPFVELLTPREKEVLKLIGEGKSNREIAGLLFVSIHTVNRHRTNIMEKLNIKRTADLVKYALRKGYI